MRRSVLVSWLVLIGCSGVGSRPDGAHIGVRPPWIPAPNREHPDFLFVTASCRDQFSLSMARVCTEREAERQIREEIGAGNVHVRGTYIQDEFFERRRTPSGEVFDVWALIAVPRAELKKAATRVSGLVVLGLSCDGDPAGCGPGLAERLGSALTKAGKSLHPRLLPPDRVPALRKEPATAGRETMWTSAAWAVLVEVRPAFESSEGGEWFGKAAVSASLIDLIGGRVTATVEIPGVKGGHVTREQAVRKAAENAVDRVASELLGRWK
jgi:hypothetical protein